MNLSQRTHDLLALLDENRILILKELTACTDTLCGCDLLERLEVPKNLLSYHIKFLREAGFIEETRCGTKKQYRIAKAQEHKVAQILTALDIL